MAIGRNLEKLHIALVRASAWNSGGGYDYENNLVRIIEQMGTELDVDISHWFSDRLLGLREQPPGEFGLEKIEGSSPPGPFDWMRAKLSRDQRDKTEDTLIRRGVSLVYFASPNRVALEVRHIPMVSTIWDLGHRDLPHFPEFRGKVWTDREHFFRETLARSYHVITDSARTGEKVEKLYGVDKNRWTALGLLVSPPAKSAVSPLHSGPLFGVDYIIYPAKRWPHKNHLLLLEAFRSVVEELPSVKLVLTGDHSGGAQDAIVDRIQALGLSQNVADLGYVDEATLSGLIANSSAVVMPSKLGPTNIPPLMAIAQGVPAIVSNAHFFESGIQRRLQVVTSDTTAEWAEKIIVCLKSKSKQVPFAPDIKASVDSLKELIQSFDQERKNWPISFQ